MIPALVRAFELGIALASLAACLSACGMVLGVGDLKDRTTDAAVDGSVDADGAPLDADGLDASDSLDAHLTGDPCQDKCILASSVAAMNELLAANACFQSSCNNCALFPDAGPLPGGGSCPNWIPGRITSGNTVCDGCLATKCCDQVKACWGDPVCSKLSDCVNACP